MSVSYYPELAITFEEPKGRAPTSDRTLPQFIRDLIGSPPAAGSGVHGWLFKLARQLHAHRDEQEIIDLLSSAVDGCGRHVPHAEIVAAVADARDCAWQPDGAAMPSATKAKPKWPAVDQAKRQAAIEADGVGLADMRGESPYPMDELDADGYLDALFPGDPLLCTGRDMRTFTTAPRESLRGKLAELALIVPSPMSALTGHRKSDGEESAHTLENTGPRHYLVTEFDFGTHDEQAATIWHLRQFAPLVMVVASGGKSLHAWFDCRGITEGAVERFFRYAATLGADPATWTRSQFVRLPGGWRHDKGTRQEVQYFSPSKCPPAESDWTAPPVDVVPDPSRAEPPVDVVPALTHAEPPVGDDDPLPDCKSTRKPLSAYLVNHSETLGMSWQQIDALRPPVIIDGCLRWGELMLLGAESKSRKSWLTQDAGFCVAGGVPWLADENGDGGFATAQARVHVLDLELNRSEMRYRFAKARANRFANDPAMQARVTAAVSSYSFDGLNVADIEPRLAEVKETVRPGDLVIVDCFYRLVPDGNETKDVAIMLELLKRFASDTQAGVILVDHFRKAGDDKARNRFAGSFVKQASASTLVAIEVTGDDVLVMNIDARTFYGCPRVHARFDPDSYTFERIPEADIVAAKEGADKAEAEGWLNYLWRSRAWDASVSSTEAGMKWAMSRQAATPRLGKLVRRGWLAENLKGSGKATEWTIKPEGKALVMAANARTA